MALNRQIQSTKQATSPNSEPKKTPCGADSGLSAWCTGVYIKIYPAD